MNLHFLIWEHGWQTAGWTMIYYLALGSLVALLAAALRWLLRSANPTLRYATSLAVFAALALMPAGIAIWLSQTPAREFRLTELAPAPPVVDLAVTPLETDSPLVEIQTPAPLPSNGPESLTAWTTAHAIEYLPWVWLAGTPLTFVLLATGLIGAERLRRTSRIVTEGPVYDAGERLRAALGVSRSVTLAICDRLATPLMVGIVRPLILLPPAALTGWSTDELEMVLLHELAHIRRWDNLVNLLQRVVESLLFFHPAVWLVSRWVRLDREDCCDATVVAHTAKPQAYAELLVALASTSYPPSHPLTHPLAGVAMARHPLAGRIRRILHLEDETMLVSRNTLVAISTALLAVVLAVSCYSPREIEADEATTNEANSTNQELLATEGTEEESSAEGFGKRLEKTMEAAVREIQRIRATGKSVGLEIHDTGAFDIVATSVADPEHLDEDAASHILFKLVHEPSSDNPAWSEVYDLPPSLRIDGVQTIGNMFERLEKDPSGPQVKIDWKWEESGRAVRITAPKASRWLWRAAFKMLTEKEPRIYSVVSYYSVPYSDARWNAPPREREIYFSTQLALIKSHMILKAVVQDTRVSQKLAIKTATDPLAWLQKNLRASFTEEHKSIRLHLEGLALNKNQLGLICDLVIERYREELKAQRKLRLPRFPSLEEQRAADVAYKLLGIELETLTTEELDRVKAKGYSGGLRVTAPTDNDVGWTTSLHSGDLLVGLHVWPTSSLEQVNKILSRDDLDQLSPLKFYVIRAIDLGKGAETIMKDMLITGRIMVNLGDWRANRQHQETIGQDVPRRVDEQRMFEQHLAEFEHEIGQLEQEIRRLEHEFTHPENNHEQQLVEIALEKVHARREQLLREREEMVSQMEHLFREREEQQPQQQTTLLYDGKTFDDWRNLWKTELKTEKRIECIKALAAFGRAGTGKEAVEVILDVAEQYDFTFVGGGNPEEELKKKVLDLFMRSNSALGLTRNEILPLVLERFERTPDKSKLLTVSLIDGFRKIDEQSRELLLDITRKQDHPLRNNAILALIRCDSRLKHDETVELARDALQGEQPNMAVLRELHFFHLDQVPEQLALFFHNSFDVRLAARSVLSFHHDQENMPPIVEPLLTTLNDPTQAEKHADAIRALKFTSFYLHARTAKIVRRRVIERLWQVLREGDEELLGPTLSALESISGSATGWTLIALPALEEGTAPEKRKGTVSEIRKQLLKDEASLEELVATEKQMMQSSRSRGRF